MVGPRKLPFRAWIYGSFRRVPGLDGVAISECSFGGKKSLTHTSTLPFWLCFRPEAKPPRHSQGMLKVKAAYPFRAQFLQARKDIQYCTCTDSGNQRFPAILLLQDILHKRRLREKNKGMGDSWAVPARWLLFRQIGPFGLQLEANVFKALGKGESPSLQLLKKTALDLRELGWDFPPPVLS